MDIGSDTLKVVYEQGREIKTLPLIPIQGQPLQRVKEALSQLAVHFEGQMVKLGLTGVGSTTLAEILGIEPVNETHALVTAIDRLYPDVSTVIEMGREGQKYILLARDPTTNRLIMEDSELGNKCSAGSGSFLDHMSKRLNFENIEEFARVALATKNPASLSGRCSVFTETDIVHLYQKGTSKARIAAGIHQAICRNYRSTFARGKPFREKVAFVGGVSENPAIIRFLHEELNLDGSLFVPDHNRTLGAIGAAMLAPSTIDLSEALELLEVALSKEFEYDSTQPLMLVQSEILTPSASQAIPTRIAVAGLGVDIGSVSTKAALVTEIDGEFFVLASYYNKTEGDPLKAVCRTLADIRDQVSAKGYEIGEIFAATTGSGRYLTGDYVGADRIINEITAQAAGALVFTPEANTVLEIGGQDSKAIFINDRIVYDYEMNKACAAGCGAFLEKQAERLGIPIEDFGDHALLGMRPPDIDWSCTVFTESALFHFQKEGVPIDELAAAVCLASVKNYLSKIIGSTPIEGNVVFQGAVAFNKGMVVAFETLLGRKITVPPYPHLTGAIGAGHLAIKQRPVVSRFRGFDEVVKGEYSIESKECQGCPNHCDLNIVTMGGSRYYYNDRCEKFSALQKPKRGENLPDLFAEREKMLFSVYDKPAPQGAKRVGIPRGLLFTEYFPLFKAFLIELGFEVVTSDATDKRIIDLGLGNSIGEPCFPYKVAHGHYVDLIQKGVDYIFAPGIMSTEQPNENFNWAQTCPYLQAAPEVIASSTGMTETGIKYIAPRLHLIRNRHNERHLTRVFMEVARELGQSATKAKQALDVGLEALARFRKWQSDRGQEILDKIPEDEIAFVVVGRPYSLYDRAVNMEIGKKIADLDILAIPQDFLPLDSVDISDDWSNTYSRQIQKKLATARIIRQDPRLRAVVITYFGCGQDSFANPFFQEELGEVCFTMQIDEHTADAGVITRLEAFADTITLAKEPKFGSMVNIVEESIGDVRNAGKILWIPPASTASEILAASLRAYGIDARVLPRADDPTYGRARRVITEDVCMPAFATTEYILQRIEEPDFDSTKEVFFQGNSNGPCRFGMYYMLQQQVLRKKGLREVHMTTLGIKSAHGGLGTHFSLVTWDGFVTHDLLEKMLHRTRPYELRPGDSDRLFDLYIKKLADMMADHKQCVEASFGRKVKSLSGTKHLKRLRALLNQAQADFMAIPRRISAEKRPLVGLVGEFFVRICDEVNQTIIRKIESRGGEVWLAPATEFFIYANYIGMVLGWEEFKDTHSRAKLKEVIGKWINHKLAKRDEHILYQATKPYLAQYEDIGAEEIVREGSQYSHHAFGGEAICSLGKAEDFAKRGLDGVISVIPFNCMPGNIVTALSRSVRKKHHGFLFLNLDYNGFLDSGRDAKIDNFMWQVMERASCLSDSSKD